MFKNTYQSGLLSIFYSCGSSPLTIWDMEVHNGHIKRLTDTEVNSLVLEIVSNNVASTYISCPKGNQMLGIRLPFLVMIVKNLKRYFSFEIIILDDKNMRRRFRISNFQSTTKIKPFCTTMPIGLSGGWNQIQFNLADFTRRAYGSQFIEACKVQVNANTRLRRIYFCDRLYPEDELPQEYKLFMPLERKVKKAKAVESKKELKSSSKTATAMPSKAKVDETTEPTGRTSEVTVIAASEPEPEKVEGGGEEVVPEVTEAAEEAQEVPADQEPPQGDEAAAGEGEPPAEAPAEPDAAEAPPEAQEQAPEEAPAAE